MSLRASNVVGLSLCEVDGLLRGLDSALRLRLVLQLVKASEIEEYAKEMQGMANRIEDVLDDQGPVPYGADPRI